MELAFLKYSFIVFGVVLILVAGVVFARLTQWLVWLKGNVPAVVIFIGGWLAVSGWTLLPYVLVTPTHSVLNASVVSVEDNKFKLLVDDGQSEYQLIGHGQHFQTRTVLVAPSSVMSMLGFPTMAVLDHLTLETSNFEQAVLANKREEWRRDYGVLGPFGFIGVDQQVFLSRQLPLVEGAIYGLMYQQGQLLWVPTNAVAKTALAQ